MNVDDANGIKRINVPVSNGIVFNSSKGTSNITVFNDGTIQLLREQGGERSGAVAEDRAG